MKTSIAILALTLISAVTSIAADDPYEGYAKDLQLLRDHYEINVEGKPIKASTGEAVAAARRLFTKVPFLFCSRDEILRILGDPATISDYGVKAKEGENASLVYRFDTGWGGAQYKLSFWKNSVVGVEYAGLE